MNGLKVQNGRLINERPCGMTGIQEAAKIRKDMKYAKKVAMIAEGVSLGELKKNLMSR